MTIELPEETIIEARKRAESYGLTLEDVVKELIELYGLYKISIPEKHVGVGSLEKDIY